MVSFRHLFPQASSNDIGTEINQLTDRRVRPNRGLEAEALKAEPASLLPSRGSELLCDNQNVRVEKTYQVPDH